MVVHPPLEYERHTVDKIGESVTLVNLQDNKGVNIFHDLVSRMPDVPFLGVEGTHGKQEYQRSHLNVDYMRTTQDMRDVWRRSKVVLMPSEYESYGMVAAEACVNGIPVIANPTPGLVECLGDAGIFIPRENTDDYERAVHLLMTDPVHYQERSDRARLRGLDLKAQTDKDLAQFVKGMLRLK
jgi:glycosyltransferase involved in cell wall biosynthesis